MGQIIIFLLFLFGFRLLLAVFLQHADIFFLLFDCFHVRAAGKRRKSKMENKLEYMACIRLQKLFRMTEKYPIM